jgi:hypothetical protein
VEGVVVIGTEVLSRLEEAGYSLALAGSEIHASGPAAPPQELRTLAAENRDSLKAAVLFSDPPAWLAKLQELYWSGYETSVTLSGTSGKAEVFIVSISIKNIAAAAAAAIGMPVLEWERIRPEVEEALGRVRGDAGEASRGKGAA